MKSGEKRKKILHLEDPSSMSKV